MKITNKIIMLLMAALLPLGFAGCNDDDEKPNLEKEPEPEFVLGQEVVRIKMGADNKAIVNIKDGGGEYAVFCLDEDVAKVEMTNGEITVEGVTNGMTSIIVSDKYNRYRRLPVVVYTTEGITLRHETIDLVTLLGQNDKIATNVLEGNGGYTIQSDNPAVSVVITELGDIGMAATSKLEDYTATVTVTDCSGFSASIAVTVKASFDPYTATQLEDIKSNATTRYYYDGRSTYASHYMRRNEVLGDGRQRFGWEFYSYYWFFVDFAGGNDVGVKSDAEFSHKNYPITYASPVKMEIIKNDGTNIWAIFSYIDEDAEILHFGYFCDTI